MVKIFFRDAGLLGAGFAGAVFLCPLKNILPARGLPVALPPYYACVPSGARTHRTRTPPPGTTTRREHAMDATTSPSDTITCAKPGCGTLTTLADSTYIDGLGQVCPSCTTPLPEGLEDLDPPF